MPQFDWRDLSRKAGLVVGGEAIEMRFSGERSQLVYVVEEDSETNWIWTVVAGRAAIQDVKDLELRAWIRNRFVDLVDFRIDRDGRLICEAAVATAGLKAEEWGLYVRTVAQAADRLEYLLTGRDIE